MEFKGKGWREVTLEKRRKKYVVEDVFIILLWLAGIALISFSIVILFITHNWIVPLILSVLGLLINIICAFADHGTITKQLLKENEDD